MGLNLYNINNISDNNTQNDIAGNADTGYITTISNISQKNLTIGTYYTLERTKETIKYYSHLILRITDESTNKNPIGDFCIGRDDTGTNFCLFSVKNPITVTAQTEESILGVYYKAKTISQQEVTEADQPYAVSPSVWNNGGRSNIITLSDIAQDGENGLLSNTDQFVRGNKIITGVQILRNPPEDKKTISEIQHYVTTDNDVLTRSEIKNIIQNSPEFIGNPTINREQKESFENKDILTYSEIIKVAENIPSFAGYAKLESPIFTGNPTLKIDNTNYSIITTKALTNTEFFGEPYITKDGTKYIIATQKYVQDYFSTELDKKANIESPNFTGTVTIENKNVSTEEYVNNKFQILDEKKMNKDNLIFDSPTIYNTIIFMKPIGEGEEQGYEKTTFAEINSPTFTGQPQIQTTVIEEEIEQTIISPIATINDLQNGINASETAITAMCNNTYFPIDAGSAYTYINGGMIYNSIDKPPTTKEYEITVNGITISPETYRINCNVAYGTCLYYNTNDDGTGEKRPVIDYSKKIYFLISEKISETQIKDDTSSTETNVDVSNESSEEKITKLPAKNLLYYPLDTTKIKEEYLKDEEFFKKYVCFYFIFIPNDITLNICWEALKNCYFQNEDDKTITKNVINKYTFISWNRGNTFIIKKEIYPQGE